MKSSPVLFWMPEVMSGAEQGPPVPVASWSLRLKLGALIRCNSRCIEEAGSLDPLRGYVGSGAALSHRTGRTKSMSAACVRACVLCEHVCARVCISVCVYVCSLGTHLCRPAQIWNLFFTASSYDIERRGEVSDVPTTALGGIEEAEE